MYFKLKNNILFRRYDGYGYITDNSMFGYRMLNDNTKVVGEKYVSQSGAVMLGTLRKTPQHIDVIVGKLFDTFLEVEYDVLKQDTIEFFLQFVHEGYLSCGETADECNYYDIAIESGDTDNNEINSVVKVENCSTNIFSQTDFLRSIHIEIASECNERCVHCYIPHECKTEAIEPALFYRIIEEGSDLNIVNVTLSGGEPLLHKDIVNFLAKCRESDLSVNVLTNLTLLTDEIIDEMRRNPLLSVQTSLYSMVPSVHDSITKVKGSFEKTKDGILKLLSVGIPLQISCPIMKQNKDSFVDVLKWGIKHNIGVLTDYVIFAAYDHSKNNLSNRLSLKEVGEAVEKQLNVEYVDMLRANAKEKNALTGEDPICSICRYNFCVSAEGKVFPCVGWQDNTIGNLKCQTIKEIWESSEEIKKLRTIKRNSFPKCVTCKDRGHCTVCMMSNSNENNDAFKVNEFHCKVASMVHSKVDSFSDIN